jgi:hypothetical protein
MRSELILCALALGCSKTAPPGERVAAAASLSVVASPAAAPITSRLPQTEMT